MLLEIQDLTKIYGEGCGECLEHTGVQQDSTICPICNSVVAMNCVNFGLEGNEILGVVGESGSGKSTLLQLIYLDQIATHGQIFYHGNQGGLRNILNATPRERSLLRNKEMSMIYQNPMIGLNYLFSAGGNVAEKIIGAGERSYDRIRSRVLNLIQRLELPCDRVDHYPDTFSGGQQQRIQIAKALSSSPRLLLLDEPTTGLDLSVQAKLLDLIRELQKEMGFAMIVVSHDLGVINHLTDVTMVMKHGCLVEYGLTDQILDDPQHPYTQLLVSSIL